MPAPAGASYASSRIASAGHRRQICLICFTHCRPIPRRCRSGATAIESKYRGRLLALKWVRSIAQGFFVVSRNVATSLLSWYPTKTFEFLMSRHTLFSVAIPDQCPTPKSFVNVSAADDRNPATFETSRTVASLNCTRIFRRTVNLAALGKARLVPRTRRAKRYFWDPLIGGANSFLRGL
jgi:hypothetical protein